MTLQLQDPPHVDEPTEVQQYADILGRVAADRQAVIVRRGGADLAAVVPLEYLELLLDMVAARTRPRLPAPSTGIRWRRNIHPPRNGSIATNPSRSEGVMVEFGQIVWTDVTDANGIRKSRPAVVVTPPERIVRWTPKSGPRYKVDFPWWEAKREEPVVQEDRDVPETSTAQRGLQSQGGFGRTQGNAHGQRIGWPVQCASHAGAQVEAADVARGRNALRRARRQAAVTTRPSWVELYEQIGRLKMELEWLKKKAAQFD